MKDISARPSDRAGGPTALSPSGSQSETLIPRAEQSTDSDLLDWLEQQARKSPTGISFDWIPSVEGEPSGFRFMRRHFIGESARTLRAAIAKAQGETA